MKQEIFREYDIRGVYPTEINEEVAYTIGRSYGSFIKEKYNQTSCVVGQDNRLSSATLANALMKGLIDSGTTVVDLGLCTTPMFAYACLKSNVIFGLMVTASHNPKEYNGFKFTFDNLGMARGKQVYDFRDYTLAGKFISGQGKITALNIFPYYKSLIASAIDMQTKPLKVVIDPANGTTSVFVKEIHEMFPNLDVTIINNKSDGTFPNHHPDPNVYENMKMLQDKVLELKADIGLAYDGDGDRLGVVDDKGQIVSTEYLMILAIRSMINQVKNPTFVYDVKCSKALEDEIKKLGGTPICYRTGASYTRYKTNEDNLPFGGEYSGHMYFNDRWPGVDCGIYNGLRILEILSKSSSKLSEMFDDVPKYVITPEIKIKVDDKSKFSIINAVINEYDKMDYDYLDIDGIKVFYENGWVLLRASNTTPNLTIRIEADTKENQTLINNHFMSILQKYLVKK